MNTRKSHYYESHSHPQIFIATNVYVALSTDYFPRSVQAFFKLPDQVTNVKKLHPGDYVTIMGTVKGLMGNVLLKDCKLYDVNNY